ncbi:bacterioferritin [Commensalibacter intestini A911]|uniref:Bacterioferritin n=1 Tax=Commensalibacter intestini A911 TaxID=1088868 RepID=G6EYD9_9PROT|nr:bacterioferritin [Commensalibacter intestini]EHD14527.1 bacterioferritin [Commensalibacter intestini A911]
MIKDKKVIEYLNIQLTNELTAINQYFLHSRILNHWGITKLGKKEYQESIEEMRHADTIIERILMLDGLPNMQRLNTVQIGENVEEMLNSDLVMEQKACKDLREAIAHCESIHDFVSRDLFLSILASEEEHIDFIETQFDLIKRITIERYITLNSDDSAQ